MVPSRLRRVVIDMSFIRFLWSIQRASPTLQYWEARRFPPRCVQSQMDLSEPSKHIIFDSLNSFAPNF